MSRKFGRKKKIDKAVDDGLSGAVWALCSCCTGLFSLAGTAVKASGTDAQPDAAGSVLRGLGSSPTSRKSLSCHESPACRFLVPRIFALSGGISSNEKRGRLHILLLIIRIFQFDGSINDTFHNGQILLRAKL